MFLILVRYYSSDDEYEKVIEKVKRGDMIGVRGKPGRLLLYLLGVFMIFACFSSNK